MSEKKTSDSLSRRQLLQHLGLAGGGTLLYQAAAGLGLTTSLQAQTTASIPEGVGKGQHVVILGAGVGGLAAAYELQKLHYHVTVLEANPIVGGRSLTLRHGDVLTENPVKPYVDTHETSSAQKCLFQPSNARGYDRPYLNAGPGRIPSAHVHVLDYCKELKVPLEIYVMESRSNLVRAKAPTHVNRHVANDARGWIAQALFELAPQVTGLNAQQQQALRELLVTFGSLGDGKKGELGVYAKDGKYQRSDRAGFRRLPGVEPGLPVVPLSLPEVLATDFWKTSFYQPEDFLWQPTLFQPVGGMDRIVNTLADAIGSSNIRTNAEVERIDYDKENGLWQIKVKGDREPVTAHACISNIPIPLLADPLGHLDRLPFSDRFKSALKTIFDMEPTGIHGFLAPTCKVGWQAERDLWQAPDPRENRVVPIYGGISWTTHPMTQLWYPSDRFFEDLGVLTGAYNFRENATTWGDYSPAWRLLQAKEGATELAGKAFGDGLNANPRDGVGLTIAWQNMKYQRGGWAQWQNVPNSVRTYNDLLTGDRKSNFYICGDQLSQLPGWQEGAIVSALQAVQMQADAAFIAPTIDTVPDSRLLVEGLVEVEIDE